MELYLAIAAVFFLYHCTFGQPSPREDGLDEDVIIGETMIYLLRALLWPLEVLFTIELLTRLGVARIRNS